MLSWSPERVIAPLARWVTLLIGDLASFREWVGSPGPAVFEHRPGRLRGQAVDLDIASPRWGRFANGLLRHHSESGPTDPYGAWREGHVSGVNRMECDQLGCAGRDCKSVYTGSNPVSTSGDWRSGSALP